MRLMLGCNNTPDLLVSVDNDFNKNNFKFHVINGGWDGVFINGYITVKGCPGGDFTSLDKREIICDLQTRLYGEGHFDYQTVFNNFDNPSYSVTLPEPVSFEDLDDDIPF